MASELKTLLSIAGSDPTGGAGIQTDVRVGASKGVHVLTAVTSLTIQNSKGFKQIGAVPYKELMGQLESIVEEVTPDAIKIGMVGSVKNLEVISDFIQRFDFKIPIVIDPVIYSTASHRFLIEGVHKNQDVSLLYSELLSPFSSVLCPNKEELNILLSEDIAQYRDLPSLLKILKIPALVIKGGHSENEKIEDVLVLEKEIITESHPRIKSKNLHGTGCLFSSLLACHLALGENLRDSFIKTSRQVYEVILKSCDYSLGSSTYGPLNINGYKK